MENKKSLKEEGNFEIIDNNSSSLIKLDGNLINLRKLDWDSGIFDLNIYRIDDFKIDNKKYIKEFIGFIISKFEGIDCMSYRVEANQMELVQNLLKSGFVLVGSPIKLSINLDKEIDFKDDNIRLFKQEDINVLSEISKNTFLNAYRYNDRNFDRKKVDDSTDYNALE